VRWETGEAGYHAQIKAENRARIIRAARDLFLAQGYDKTSLAQITREARVSTGALFMCSTSSRLRPAIPGTA
jgi:AcrR family transcriptional regulator